MFPKLLEALGVIFGGLNWVKRIAEAYNLTVK